MRDRASAVAAAVCALVPGAARATAPREPAMYYVDAGWGMHKHSSSPPGVCGRRSVVGGVVQEMHNTQHFLRPTLPWTFTAVCCVGLFKPQQSLAPHHEEVYFPGGQEKDRF